MGCVAEDSEECCETYYVFFCWVNSGVTSTCITPLSVLANRTISVRTMMTSLCGTRANSVSLFLFRQRNLNSSVVSRTFSGRPCFTSVMVTLTKFVFLMSPSISCFVLFTIPPTVTSFVSLFETSTVIMATCVGETLVQWVVCLDPLKVWTLQFSCAC